MPEAIQRANELVALIDAVIQAYVGADETPLPLPHEVKGRRPTAADQRYLLRVVKATRKIQRIFEADLHRSFLHLGERVGRAYHELKEPGDDLTVEMIMRAAGAGDFAAQELDPIFRKAYILTGEAIYGAVSERVGLAIAWNIEDHIARQIIEAGGKRVGIVDVVGTTRGALFDALHDGRVAGEGAADMARRIREYVPAGRFTAMEADRPGSGIAYRSEMISRTETTYARNISALGAGQQAGFEDYVVFDARLGPTDDECEALDGTIVSAAEAQQLLDQEHPNGTRSISPSPRH